MEVAAVADEDAALLPGGVATQEARAALLAWFGVHRRDLPWRRTRDPYAIWVSEIMLQQTRVAAVMEHYARWMERFPTVAALAAAGEPEVLALWSGLGYYRRARMLHRAAQLVVEAHGGVLPETAAALQALPGIGAYTAAAVASIAFGEPVAVVDGNVERVALRMLGADALKQWQPETAAGKARAVRTLAQSLVDEGEAGDSNQAMMELGATVCLPKAPLCLQCPLQRWCATRGEHATTARKPLQAKQVVYGLAIRERGPGHEHSVWLRRRDGEATLMAGMWELPEIVSEDVPGVDSGAALGAGEEPVLRLRHAITVTNYQVSVVGMQEGAAQAVGGAWIGVDELPEMALTG
jgi:A/G-specific adenine glycosylase